ncbi:uncharacterized protein SPPG_04920 [Spizellomyces punctatus DAOM BR117]|uniref:Uncharacterized protein n=1 Tax=Spizellomyces punctatus (strain DAOM BR117) TaxID=645134 RepID=A0A0L0HEW5_SPIPD|nr:uncharacterized protein SPPG_04920 [Spizellomyces punctatus DAOM BR117]KNC99529.1 hypothetical protein SPPG_04920 [Spizellomyces punctatus DAOM BR117]|eukprot:XP_016607569.1 hypothetical protein SPPG_04920 [Spizellomyces punctatus DAOM BR117]
MHFSTSTEREVTGQSHNLPPLKRFNYRPSLTSAKPLPTLAALLTYKTWGIPMPPECHFTCYTTFLDNLLKLAPYPARFPLVLIAATYISRLREVFPEASGEEGVEVRLFKTAFVLAWKVYGAEADGEMMCGRGRVAREMEREFLKGINYTLQVSPMDIFKLAARTKVLVSQNPQLFTGKDCMEVALWVEDLNMGIVESGGLNGWSGGVS